MSSFTPRPPGLAQPSLGPAIKQLRRRWLAFLAVLGPGFISATAGNDAGGIATYSSIGAAFGTSLLWALVLVTLALMVIQEMVARMGVVTGKGLAELIREQFGVGWTAVAMLTLLVANASTTIAEFAGIAAAAELFGIPRYLAVPLMAVLVWAVVVRTSYRVAERVFLALALALGSYVLAAFLARPDWGAIARDLITPTLEARPSFLIPLITLTGTTITPYMQFFLQSAIVDKGIDLREYRLERLEVLFSSLLTGVIAFFIVVSTATTLHPAGIEVDDAADAARALAPLAGPYASVLFGIGLFGASMLAASVLPLSTAYAIAGAFGWERSISRSWREAPAFHGMYTALIILGSAVVLLPGLPLVATILLSQFVNGLLLPIVLLFILQIVNDRRVMGDHVNSLWHNVLAWAVTSALIVLSALVLVSSVVL